MPFAPADASRKKNLTESNLEEKELRDDAFIAVATVTADRKKWYHHGYGSSDRNDADTGYSYAQFYDDEGNEIEGTLRLMSYHSEDMEQPKSKGFMDEYDLEDLHESYEESRSDRVVVPFQTQGQGATEDEVLAWEIKVDSDHDGATLDPDECNVKIPYSEYRRA